MREFLWRIIAFIATHSAVFEWLIRRSARTPYFPILSPDKTEIYMLRYWLFNPYPGLGDESKRFEWLPSIRLHKIMVPDRDRHLHDHPWNARTIVLRGRYVEERMDGEHVRDQGDTCRVLFNQYHRIVAVSPGGVWTMWFTWKYRGTWGFLVDGAKVPWRKYLGLDK